MIAPNAITPPPTLIEIIAQSGKLWSSLNLGGTGEALEDVVDVDDDDDVVGDAEVDVDVDVDVIDDEVEVMAEVVDEVVGSGGVGVNTI